VTDEELADIEARAVVAPTAPHGADVLALVQEVRRLRQALIDLSTASAAVDYYDACGCEPCRPGCEAACQACAWGMEWRRRYHDALNALGLADDEAYGLFPDWPGPREVTTEARLTAPAGG